METHRLSELLSFGQNFLREKSISSSYIDCQLFMMNICSFNKVQLFTNNDYELSVDQKDTFLSMVYMRANHKPVQYILNKCEFMSLDFYVDENVLIPRPDTEILVEKSIDVINKNNCIEVLDLCTGSGCIAISLAHYCKNVNVNAIDVSCESLKVAKKNSSLNNVNINFILSDVFENAQSLTNKIDLIVSNPPYVRRDVIGELDDNVKKYEPLLALDGGFDGLNFYRKICKESKKLYYNKKGFLLFEIGHDQGAEVSKILKDNNYKNIEIIKDLAGYDRVVYSEYEGN